jgi:pimeloyl-ACP methyl ester carboxylesterase
MEKITLQHDGLELSALVGGTGPLVILMHGFPDTYESWSSQWQALVSAGYRCLVPVMRGYDSGSAKKGVEFYAMERIAGDVAAWMDFLQEERAHIVGHDWGAVCAYLTASLFPQRVASLTTLAIPHVSGMRVGMRRHPIQLINSSYMLLFQWRGLSEWIVRRRNFAFIEFLWRRWSPNLAVSTPSIERVKTALEQPAVLTATLNYYRAFFAPQHKPRAELMSRALEMPTLMIAGETDACMDVRLYDYIDESSFLAEHKVVRLPDAGHFMQIEASQAINRLLLEWITQHSSTLNTEPVKKPSVV